MPWYESPLVEHNLDPEAAKALEDAGVLPLDGQLSCDFCSAPSPTWEYPASDFGISVGDELEAISDGSWAACDTCHGIIERKDRYMLATRMASKLAERFPELRDDEKGVLREVQELLDKFFAHRIGMVRPIATA